MNYKVLLNLIFFTGIFVLSGFVLKNCLNEKDLPPANVSSDTSKVPAERIYGVTLESVHNKFEKTLYSLGTLGKKPTSRVVFDNDEEPAKYLEEVRKIHISLY